MSEVLTLLRVVVVLPFLLYASWRDFKTREVSNKVWAVLFPVGLTLTLIHTVLFESNLLNVSATVLLVSAFSLLMFYIRAWGGADTKAFICLAVAFPFVRTFSEELAGFPFPLQTFPPLVLFLALCLAFPFAVAIIVRNVIQKRDWSRKALPFIPFLTGGFILALLFVTQTV